MVISESDKRVTAIHEAGHALLTVVLPNADPVHKVTIIPRGMALGLTMSLPAHEKHNYSKNYLLDQIGLLLGGRIAEELTTGDITTGTGNDLERATELARRMVCEWGMSEAMGPLTFGKKEGADLPGPRDRPAPGLQRGHGGQDRRRGSAHRPGELHPRAGPADRPQGSPGVIVGGESTGGVLVLRLAALHPEITAVLSYATALRLAMRQRDVLKMRLAAPLVPYISKGPPPDDNPW